MRLSPDSLQVALKQPDRLHHHPGVVTSQSTDEEMSVKLVSRAIFQGEMI
jgi:hypothetical protein